PVSGGHGHGMSSSCHIRPLDCAALTPPPGRGLVMRMKQLFVSIALAAASTFAAGAHAADITGAGATFPYPIYAKWAEMYKKASGNGLNYQSVGSGAGIKQIKAKTVDFGASDMPLPSEELNQAGLFQFPAIMGGVVTVVN